MNAAPRSNRRVSSLSRGSLGAVGGAVRRSGDAAGYTLANNRPTSSGETRLKFSALRRATADSACPLLRIPQPRMTSGCQWPTRRGRSAVACCLLVSESRMPRSLSYYSTETQ